MRSLYSKLVDYWPHYEASGTPKGVASGLLFTNLARVDPVAGKIIGAGNYGIVGNSANEIASSATVQTGDIDFTWCVWVQRDGVGATQTIISKDNNSGTGREYNLTIASGTPTFTVYRTGPAAKTATSSVSTNTSSWYFICCGHDAAADLVWIEVNGTYDSTATTGALQAAGAGALRIGAMADDSNYADCDICEIGFWKRMLTPAERFWLYNSGRGRTYPFDGRPNTERASARLRRNRMTGLIG